MNAYWEWLVIGLVLGGALVYIVVREFLLLRYTIRWYLTWHRDPVYGAPDVERRSGPGARPNIRKA